MCSLAEIKPNIDTLNKKGVLMKKENCIDCGTLVWAKGTRCKPCNGKTMVKHKETKTKLFSKWADMTYRCTNHNSKSYKNYGGRGITVCDEWKDNFIAFRDWSLANGYKESGKLSIDRIDNNKGYSPDNCRYATQTEQMRNTRVILPSNTSGYRGVTKTKFAWVAKIKVDRKSIYIGSFKTAKEAGEAYDNYVKTNNLNYPLNSSIGDN